jgi:hypothetical protein
MKSLDQMIESMHEHAKHVLIGHNDEQLLPFFHVQFKDREDAVIPAPFTDERQKSAFIRAIRMSLKMFKPSVVNYAFVSEAWVATQTHRPRPGDLTPAQREDKRECVVVSGGDRDRATMKMWEIVRDDKGRVTDLVEDKAQMHDSFEGRLHNLMAED